MAGQLHGLFVGVNVNVNVNNLLGVHCFFHTVASPFHSFVTAALVCINAVWDI